MRDCVRISISLDSEHGEKLKQILQLSNCDNTSKLFQEWIEKESNNHLEILKNIKDKKEIELEEINNKIKEIEDKIKSDELHFAEILKKYNLQDTYMLLILLEICRNFLTGKLDINIFFQNYKTELMQIDMEHDKIIEITKELYRI